MSLKHPQVDSTIEMFKKLWAELSSLAASGDFFFGNFSAKVLILISKTPDSQRRIFVRRHDEFTLAYDVRIPNSPDSEHYVEVVRDQNDGLKFQENDRLLTPRELATKLVDLVTKTGPRPWRRTT